MALVERLFTQENSDPFEGVVWKLHNVHIEDKHGKAVFHQDAVAFPDFWSDSAVQVVASKYFCHKGDYQESSLIELLRRVIGKIANEGLKAGYFGTTADQDTFEAELSYLVLNQYVTFNSPVWFSIGLDDRPQRASACYIVEVDDSMEGILDWYKLEGMIFTGGSGSGVNISSLRGKGEPIAKGGVSSGAMSFARAADISSGAIKSAGTTRRSAKMLIMNTDHPDIMEFIKCKALEESKASALLQAGWDGSFEGEVAQSLFFQNANNSVRMSDAFLHAVENDEKWQTRTVVSKEICEEYSAREMLYEIAKSTWLCGDPGVQFDDTIHTMHPCKADGRQSASNPCSEYLFLNWTSCNLATLNLLKFKNPFLSSDPQGFDHLKFQQAVKVLTMAQDILIAFADSPTEHIATETRKYRTIGLNYANLGAYLMSLGLAYDSAPARDFASRVTSLMTAYAYQASAHLAKHLGAFERFQPNKEHVLDVLRWHRAHSIERAPDTQRDWDLAIADTSLWGVRNAQVSLAAPTGTVSFMLGADTTGVEPAIALVAEKHLAGGGSMHLVNGQVSQALRSLGYTESESRLRTEDLLGEAGVNAFLDSLKSESHRAVFDCALPHGRDQRFIEPEAHIQMVAAIQPFLSMGISKTINVPHETTVDEIASLYMLAWKQGLKSVAIYRDGSKQAQPLTTQKALATLQKPQEPFRRKLPDERPAVTHKFSIGGLEGYITVGLYQDGSPGEVFLSVSKQGTTLSGLTDGFATLLSLALQYGVPLEDLVRKFSYMRFEPMGYTTNPDLKVSTSLIDYLFRWLESRFLTKSVAEHPQSLDVALLTTDHKVYDSPMCQECGGATIRAGSCFVCQTCFQTTGCS